MAFIRKATQDDIPALIDVARRGWMHAFEAFMPEQEVAYWKRDETNRRFVQDSWRDMFVPDVNGEAAGFVRVKEATVLELFVHPRHHRLGLGRKLLATAEREIARNGHERGTVECPQKSVGAVAFYESGGWAVSKTYQGYWGYPDLWAVVLNKAVAANRKGEPG